MPWRQKRLRHLSQKGPIRRQLWNHNDNHDQNDIDDNWQEWWHYILGGSCDRANVKGQSSPQEQKHQWKVQHVHHDIQAPVLVEAPVQWKVTWSPFTMIFIFIHFFLNQCLKLLFSYKFLYLNQCKLVSLPVVNLLHLRKDRKQDCPKVLV